MCIFANVNQFYNVHSSVKCGCEIIMKRGNFQTLNLTNKSSSYSPRSLHCIPLWLSPTMEDLKNVSTARFARVPVWIVPRRSISPDPVAIHLVSSNIGDCWHLRHKEVVGLLIMNWGQGTSKRLALLICLTPGQVVGIILKPLIALSVTSNCPESMFIVLPLQFSSS